MMVRGSARREDACALALLALLVIATFANVVFGGRSLVPSESINPLDNRPHAHLKGPDFVPPDVWARRNLVVHANMRDITAGIMQSDPSREFLRRSLVRGTFPFWDPYVGGGAPSFASLVPAYLFPPSLLVVLLGNGSLVNNLYILLLIFCSGAFTYWLLRAAGLRWLGAMTGACAFALSGAVLETVSYFAGQPVAMFSIPLLVTVRLVQRPDASRATQLALAFAFVALASFPPMLLQTFGLCVVLVAVAVARNHEHRARIAAWFAAGAAVSLLLTAFVYLPAIAVMAEMPHVQAYYAQAAHAVIPVERLYQLLSPSILGGPPIYARPPAAGETGHQMYYTGVATLLLAMLGVVARATPSARALKIALSACGVLAVAKLVGLPPVQWIEHVPLLRNFHYAAYLGVLVAYAAALLAAFGVDALLDGRVRGGHVVLSASTLAAALIVLRIAAWQRGVASRPEGWRWIADFDRIAFFAAAVALASWFACRSAHRKPAIVAIVAFLLVAEGMVNGIYPRPRRWNVWTHPPRYVERLESTNRDGRILPLPVFPANASSVYRQPSTDSILTASTRMYTLYRTYFGPIPDVILRETTRIPPDGVLDAASVEYLTIAPAYTELLVEAARRGYETIHADDWVHLVRRDSAPRYFFTSDYRLARDAADALQMLPTLARGSVVVERRPSFSPVRDSFVRPERAVFDLDETEITIDAPRPGLLVCSESHMRGWTAMIDGRPARIVPANYAFRAVEVPAGRHTIRLTYQPPGWSAGIAPSLLGCVLCALRFFGSRAVRMKGDMP